MKVRTESPQLSRTKALNQKPGSTTDKQKKIRSELTFITATQPGPSSIPDCTEISDLSFLPIRGKVGLSCIEINFIQSICGCFIHNLHSIIETDPEIIQILELADKGFEIQAYLKNIVGLVPDHCNKTNITIKQVK